MKPAVAVAIVAVTLALPGIAQQPSAAQAGHTASTNHSGGYAAHSGIRAPSSFIPPGRLPGAPGLSNRILPSPNFHPGRVPLYSGYRAPDLRGRFPYQPGYHQPEYRNNPDHRNRYGRDHRRRDYRDHHRYAGGYSYGYPVWTNPYPWVNSFTLSGWDNDSDYTGSGENGPAPDYAQAPPYNDNSAPYPDYNGHPEPSPVASGARPPYQPAPAPAPQPSTVSSISSREPLTLLFKDGRAPEKIQNYMMSGTTLTNLDPQHFEEIPLDEVDVAATAKLNRAHGIIFQVPGAPGE